MVVMQVAGEGLAKLANPTTRGGSYRIEAVGAVETIWCNMGGWKQRWV